MIQVWRAQPFACIKCKCNAGEVAMAPQTGISSKHLALGRADCPGFILLYWQQHVVYLDQLLGAAHSKRSSKWPFSAFFVQKNQKKQEICSKF